MNEQAPIVDVSRVVAALDLTTRVHGIAVERAQVAVAKERSEITAKLIKCGAAASALIIVSIGLAIWLAQRTPIPAEPPALNTELRRKVSQSDVVSPNKIMTKVVLFNSIEGKDILSLSNSNIVDLVAGHEYVNSNSDRWEAAWCYATFRQGGMRIRLDLAMRSQSTFTPREASQEELRHLGLSASEVSSLRNRCPWREQ